MNNSKKNNRKVAIFGRSMETQIEIALEAGYIKDKNTEYIIPECYYATQNEVEEFDKTFQHKAKHKYSIQIF